MLPRIAAGAKKNKSRRERGRDLPTAARRTPALYPISKLASAARTASSRTFFFAFSTSARKRDCEQRVKLVTAPRRTPASPFKNKRRLSADARRACRSRVVVMRGMVNDWSEFRPGHEPTKATVRGPRRPGRRCRSRYFMPWSTRHRRWVRISVTRKLTHRSPRMSIFRRAVLRLPGSWLEQTPPAARFREHQSPLNRRARAGAGGCRNASAKPAASGPSSASANHSPGLPTLSARSFPRNRFSPPPPPRRLGRGRIRPAQRLELISRLSQSQTATSRHDA